jgi:hypothetical protein
MPTSIGVREVWLADLDEQRIDVSRPDGEVLDEVFGEDNFCSGIVFQKAPYATSTLLPPVYSGLP